MAAAKASGHLGRVLVVDDDDGVCVMLRSSLTFGGFEVSTAGDVASAMVALTRCRPDVIVLDVSMPRVDGYDLVRLLRQRGSTVPVLFLSARDAVEDRVRGLRLGADDYITKPFSVIEVTARLEGLLRRVRTVDESGGAVVLRCGDLTIDEERHLIRRSDRLINLSPTEFRLLGYLMRNQEQVRSKAQILDHLLGYDVEGDDTLVDRFVFSLRRKIGTSGPPLLHTVRGFGYTLRADSSP